MSGQLTPEMLAHVGRSRPSVTEQATRREIRKYSIATGQRLEKYLNGDEAPPLFHLALFWDVVDMEKLSEDGDYIDPLLPELPFKQALAGGNITQYYRPILAGDVLIAHRTLTDLYEKQGRSGLLFFYEVVLEVEHESGTPVLTHKTTRIYR